MHSRTPEKTRYDDITSYPEELNGGASDECTTEAKKEKFQERRDLFLKLRVQYRMVMTRNASTIDDFIKNYQRKAILRTMLDEGQRSIDNEGISLIASCTFPRISNIREKSTGLEGRRGVSTKKSNIRKYTSHFEHQREIVYTSRLV